MTAEPACRVVSKEVLAQDWGVLTKVQFDLRRRSGAWQRQTREVYDRGNGATCLLYNPDTGCVLLTRQFRLPVFLNGGFDGLIEAPAGLLDGVSAAERMRAELVEETGFAIEALTHQFDVYMSPGSVTEYLAFFTGLYRLGDQASDGGGLYEEGEDIEVLHVPLAAAMQMIAQGEIRDGKTIILVQHLMIAQMMAGRDVAEKGQ